MTILKRVMLILLSPFILLMFAIGTIYEGSEDETE